jgi:hypothetical protein
MHCKSQTGVGTQGEARVGWQFRSLASGRHLVKGQIFCQGWPGWTIRMGFPRTSGMREGE